uniref:Chromosome 1 open reading frame 198 n=1 Tax=Urocitellus parryii TaxID=9999 RepID=A0A8D2IFK0_UROPR
MASMAAAIAASRSAVMSGNRPLDERERKRFTYFSSLSPMARKIMQDKEKIREKYGPEWARLPPAQQDAIIDRCLVGPRASAPADPGYSGDPEDPVRFPGLRGPTGQKVVRFGDEDITWQDEHSAPFSWETRSQMEFSLSSLCIQEPSSGASTSELRPLPKASQGPQALKTTQGSRSSSLDALGPARKEDEAPFWKINAERSREGPEAGFQSLTPSQIKSMEKGEKILPACYRQEQWVLPSVSVDRERPPPAQATSGMLPEDQLSEPLGKPLSLDTSQDEDSALGSEPTPAQSLTGRVLREDGNRWAWPEQETRVLASQKCPPVGAGCTIEPYGDEKCPQIGQHSCMLSFVIRP